MGFGFDVHTFSNDSSRRLLLGGVEFPGERGLEGHSDADVVLHALTDALLGSIGAGDIGQLFPNTDPAYAGADSLLFLRRAVELVTAQNGQIVSADVTVLAEEPKLGDHREKIRERISQELCVPARRVNIKATTMEGMGAIGRKEGIAAMAAVTVMLNEKYEE
jgi:2-C-methyl-D-erythritol 4-phosphate cytidylyltransferase/2-C-methyl-D-erythritol 2,4-cyclodiphosphate synthase